VHCYIIDRGGDRRASEAEGGGVEDQR
jgi:hypothetical protein